VKPQLILALDTTAEHGSLALARGAQLLEEVALHSTTGFSQILYLQLAQLLARHAVTSADIECFAAANGPGSFTGVRVGLACIMGLAEAHGRPAVAVSNLEALASFGSAPLRAPVIDARRGQIYAALYDAAGRLVSAEVVTTLAEWQAALPAGAELITATPPLAGFIAAIAYRRMMRGEAGVAAGLDANYVRRSDAELFWKEI
jgi:tRNA threonylcarbamoyladenosine biosynthesis protein TsaB